MLQKVQYGGGAEEASEDLFGNEASALSFLIDPFNDFVEDCR
jgi:hypothetical protein